MTTDEEDKLYLEHAIIQWRRMLDHCIDELSGYGVSAEQLKAPALLSERQRAIDQLRELCAEFGDNDWPNDLDLADVIEKHLGRKLYADYRNGEGEDTRFD